MISITFASFDAQGGPPSKRDKHAQQAVPILNPKMILAQTASESVSIFIITRGPRGGPPDTSSKHAKYEGNGHYRFKRLSSQTGQHVTFVDTLPTCPRRP